MNPFKCRHCDRPAHFYFRDGGMLCVDHAEAFCLAQAQDMLERSRLDKSSCGGVEGHAESGQGARKGSTVEPFDSATLNKGAGFESGPHDSIPFPRFIPPEAGAPVVTPLPVTAGAALSESPGEVDRAAVVHSSVVERCAAADVGFDDLPIFPARRNATASRVIASSATQVPKSSSDIPNHHQ